MSTATAPAPTPAPTGRISLRRTASLARWNAVLLTRNRLAFFYAVVLPLLPLLLLLAGDRGSVVVGATAVGSVFLTIGLFPVYYNVLAQFVSRRDELVLKRMRTGEARDLELILSIALPGAASAVLIAAVSVPVAAALGQPLPVNPVLYAALVVFAVIMFSAFAYWTAAWTRSAEAAQLTSMPIILLTALGPLGTSLAGTSDTLANLIALTPGAAMSELVRVGWFGLDGADATASTLGFIDAFGPAVQPLVVMAAWTVVAIDLARRSMRWEPRS